MENNKNTRGFTLLELMITLSIAVILTTIGIPSFMTLIRDSRMTANANDLLTTINYARSEAVTRNVDVIVKSKNSSNDWKDGWDVYIDTNDNGDIDAGELLKTHDALVNGLTLNSDITGELVYKSDGLINGGGNFFLCFNNDTDSARVINISSVGRANIDTTGQCEP